MRELLVAGRRRVHTVWIARGQQPSARIDEIVARAEEAGAQVRHSDAERVHTEARTESPQGVVAIAEPLAAVPIDRLCAASSAFLLALEGVTDPRNLGAALRTAETAGATGAVLPRHRSALLGPTAMKAAAGAVEYLDIAAVGGVPAALDQLRRAGVWTVGLDVDGPTSVFELDLADAPLAFVLGAEGRGLSRLARARCDVLARVPMRGQLESLNVSAAAAVACFEVARRRGR